MEAYRVRESKFKRRTVPFYAKLGALSCLGDACSLKLVRTHLLDDASLRRTKKGYRDQSTRRKHKQVL